jgi:starch-binding outer membrane protein, SusD/RagB family
MKKIHILGLSFMAAMLTFTSCESVLDVKPRLNIATDVALTTAEGMDAALNGVYDRLQSTNLYGRDLIAIPDALSDNGRATNKSGRLNPEYRNTAGAHFINWQFAYLAINQINLILDALPNIKTYTDAKKALVEGQAKYIRALLYFDLMRAYAYEPGMEITTYNQGGVPIILKGISSQDQIDLPSRPAIKDVYTQIYTDLTDAVSKLTDFNNSVYPTKGAAQGLYSRVALYNKDFANAAKFATDALASKAATFSTNATYIAGWRAARHPEALFELIYVTAENIGVNTSLQTTYTTLVTLGNRTTTGGFGDLVPSAALLADLDSEKDSVNKITVLDIRRQLYELGTAGRGTAEIECTKFLGKNGAVNLDNIPIMRMSEMYLNRAEARALSGDETGALTDINVIRTRAGLYAAKKLTGAALITEIAKQRRLELAFEGHRWFDLKRRGQDIVKPLTGNIPYNDFRILANIPLNEVSTNKNIKQNFGY